MFGILSGPPTPMWRAFSQQLSKNIPPKSGGCRIVRGVKCHFKVSNDEVTAKCSKPPSVSLKIRVDVNHSKVRVKLHLWLHTQKLCVDPSLAAPDIILETVQ